MQTNNVFLASKQNNIFVKGVINGIFNSLVENQNDDNKKFRETSFKTDSTAG